MIVSDKIRLAVFDVDGVIVPIKSSWEYLHKKLGTVEEARINYELFKRRSISYWEWMFLDTLAWVNAKPGITIWELSKIYDAVEILPEAYCGVKLLRRNGVEVALVSGGVGILVSKVACKLGIKYWHAPQLCFDPWGRLVPGGYPVVEADRKDKIVRKLARRLGIPLRNTAFIGDSSWDLKAMREVGLAIAVNTNDPEVTSHADVVAGDVCEAARIIVEANRG